MGLKEKGRVKVLTATGQTLQADADESFLVREILAVSGSAVDWLNIFVEGTQLGRFRTYGKAGNHIPVPGDVAGFGLGCTLFRLLAGLGWPIEYRIATGETMEITWDTNAVDSWAVIVYDIYDAADIKAEDMNGSRSKVRRYVHYGDNAAVAAVAEEIDTSDMWTGGAEWPFDAEAVGEGHVYRIKGILSCPVAIGDGTAHVAHSTYLQLMKRGTVLFDEDRQGLPFRGDAGHTAATDDYDPDGSVIGPMSEDNPNPPLIFDPALEFVEGDTLLTRVLFDAVPTGLTAGAVEVGYLIEHSVG